LISRSALFIALLTLALSAAATDYYVAPRGSDSNPGTKQKPFRTLQHAADVVKPGDTVIVADGTYSNPSASGTGSTLVNATRGGNSGAWVTFRAQNKWGAVLDGLSNTTAEGWEFVASYIRVQDFEIRGFSDDAFSNYRGGQFIHLVGNHIHHMGRYCTDTGIGRDGIFLSKSNVTVEQNLIHDIGRFGPGENGCSPGNTNYQANDHAIYVAGASNVMIRNNIFYNVTHGWSIQVYPDATDGLSILNNTFIGGTPYEKGQILIANAATNSRIENNIFYQPTTAAIYFSLKARLAAHSLTVGHNLSTTAIAAATGSGDEPKLAGVAYTQNQVNTDPRLVSVADRDFRVRHDSPAIGRGASTADVVSDHDGRRRATTPTIGAYEPPAEAARASIQAARGEQH